MSGRKYNFHSLTFWGTAAAIAAAVSYGLNPLFGKPLLENGVSVSTMLFFRYFISVVLMGGYMLFRRERFSMNLREASLLLLLGVLFACSSIFLFVSYDYVPSGLATTVIYLYPVFVALIMIILRVYPSWQVLLSIGLTLAGVVLMSLPSGKIRFSFWGIVLASLSALSYAAYLVIINRSRTVARFSNSYITFYALLIGAFMFAAKSICSDKPFLSGVDSPAAVLNLLGLAVFPTVISLATITYATRTIGPVKTAVLGVFEPITAILIGFFCFSETLSLRMLAGITVCAFAVIFMTVSEKGRASGSDPSGQ